MKFFSGSEESLSLRIEWWLLLHSVMFLAFYWFLSPLQHVQDADRNSRYFWFINLSTYFLLITVFRHTESAPAGATVPFRFSKVMSFFLPALVLGLPGFFIVEGVLRMRGISMRRTQREYISNLLLMASALSLQYGFCKQEEGVLGVTSNGYCDYLDSPISLQLPVVITMLLLYGISWLVQRILGRRHGFLSAGPVLAKHPQAEEEAEKRRGPHPKLRKAMVSWYSLFMTTYIPQVTVMLKVFMGRFDVRTLLAALTREPEDTLTFEDQSDKEETWFDFFADGGDGFDSSYTVGRLIAQPYLGVDVPKDAAVAEKVSKLPISGVPVRGPGQGRSSDSFAIKRHNSMPILGHGANRVRTESVSSETHLTGLQRVPSDSGTGHRRIMLPRASVVFHGGDLAYPVPSHKAFVNRLIRPLEWALPPYEEVTTTESKSSAVVDQPQFFAIPGNHDWYDGLEVYLHWLVGQDHLAGWKLPQKCSYFAVKLSHGWWIWGLDLSLSYDLDRPQYEYFCGLLDSGKVSTEDRVVVITHRPNWEMGTIDHGWFMTSATPSQRTGYLLSVLLDKIGEPRLAMRLAGDVHHYSRYMPSVITSTFVLRRIRGGMISLSVQDGSKGVPLVTSGGAGAFLHPTHFPPKDILQKEYTRVESYPPEKVSRRLTWLNPIQFRRRNWGADVVLGMWYLAMSISALPLCDAGRVLKQPNALLGLYEFVVLIIEAYDKIFRQSYVSLVGQIIFIAMCIGCAEEQMGQAKRFIVGLIHGMCHSLAAVSAVCLVECFCEYLSNVTPTASGGDALEILDSTEALIVSALGPFWVGYASSRNIRSHRPLSIGINASNTCFPQFPPIDRFQYLGYLGSVSPFLYIIMTPIASFIFGVYLVISLNYLGQHWNEAFSSLRIQDYKHFLRMWISPDTGDLHIFVIGIDHVARHWEADPYWDGRLLPQGSHVPSWKWITPSKYRPKSDSKSKEDDLSFWARKVEQGLGPSPSDYRKPQPDGQPKLVDYFVIEASKKQAVLAEQELASEEKSPHKVITEAYSTEESTTSEGEFSASCLTF
ncbi:hypothetical protein Pmar_PMAR020755 [Perkinsus marinus ATCC 50983]|uniref:Calcineurin-like phosphoesterase domain-containing protein n=1 Tax=Perkinsus marinus (strain ATCC 50983 / TXsc) TaxID=423536 RepID=C5KQR9_PERM5|nr:hypothetical protein Pmar_PMAR020755 [Perkinsus marinus ATCC 50983]EER13165.1 hypothetical protein Pmar_PMAR020755 [Perkinsus marinus ATCC 50983]|eukprot:XP_002781370.1 hypothetical protein Pmar_PMAR020755 [Perkinsus marinus ATCC 50983]